MTFRDALTRIGISIRTSSSDPQEVSICCIFCGERGESADTRFRLGVNTQTGWAHCFNCGWKSRHALGYLLRKLGSTDRVESVDDSFTEEVEDAPDVCLPDDFMKLARCYDDLDRKARTYLLQRGITKEQIRRNGIGVSYFGQYAYYVVFPVMDGKQLRGFVARDFTGTRNKRYLNSPGDKYLYNYCKPARRVLLSEGIFKALRLEQATPDFCSMALLGHDITDVQIDQLKAACCREAVLWPDPDPVGRRGMVSVADKLSEVGVTVFVQTNVKTPADEVPLEKLKAHLLGGKALKYSWGVRQSLL